MGSLTIPTPNVGPAAKAEVGAVCPSHVLPALHGSTAAHDSTVVPAASAMEAISFQRSALSAAHAGRPHTSQRSPDADPGWEKRDYVKRYTTVVSSGDDED